MLKEQDFAGKKIVPFCTFGSGGLNTPSDTLRKTLPKAQVLKGYGIRTARVAAASKELDRFLKENGYKKGMVEKLTDYSAQQPVTDQEMAKMYYDYNGNYEMQSKIASQYKQYDKILEHVDNMDMTDAEFKTHSQLGIAYNNSHVTKYTDFKPCSVVSVSEEEDVDLATIQLDDMQTPEGTYIFHLRDNDNPLTLDQKLYMIGFNKGFTIAKTAQGIRSQCYSGNVTQKDDGVQILYSIPSQPESSGSPVIDEYGNLVAVHFAGYTGTQSFNYGIPSKRIRQFLIDN